MGRVLLFQERIDGDYYNHGAEGTKTEVTKFISAFEAREDERDKMQKRHNTRMTVFLTVIGLMIALLAGILAIPPCVAALKDLLHSDLHLDRLFHTRNNVSPVNAVNVGPQDARSWTP